jgi:hypothetical protein
MAMRILLILLALVALGAWTYPCNDPYYQSKQLQLQVEPRRQFLQQQMLQQRMIQQQQAVQQQLLRERNCILEEQRLRQILHPFGTRIQ